MSNDFDDDSGPNITWQDGVEQGAHGSLASLLLEALNSIEEDDGEEVLVSGTQRLNAGFKQVISLVCYPLSGGFRQRL